jgi:predicted deacylase
VLDVVLDLPGRHEGALRIPFSRQSSAYGQIVIPVLVVSGAPGPTALLFGGVHGDEYEGQIVLPGLAGALEGAALHGRVILVPRANPLAARAGQRNSPEDGANLARRFPGDPSGGPTDLIAAAIMKHLLPLADAVIDLHAGGSSLEYLCTAWGRLPRDRELAGRTLDLLESFGADFTAVIPNPESGGTLVAAALGLGIPAAAAELGGGGAVSPASIALAREGCLRALSHLGIISGPLPRRTRLLRVRPEDFLRSPASGLFEPNFTLGEQASAGTIAGWLHDPERLIEPPLPLCWPSAGLVLCRRVPTACAPGDVLAHLAEPTDRGSLLDA